MSEKNLEMMKKLLDKKKVQQSEHQKMIPTKKIGSGQGTKSNQKATKASKKV